jgi:hypothetical protein
MLKTQMKFAYRAYGLTIHSELILPELMEAGEERSKADVSIRLNAILKTGFEGEPYDFIVDNGSVSFKMPDAGVFRVQDGNTIMVSPYSHADEALIRLYVLGTCCGILLLQRGDYPLHGSAIAVGGKAIAIVGQSGAGKSTLASAMLEKGHGLISDDVIPVAMPKDDGPPMAASAYPQQKLWQSSLEAFGRSATPFMSIYGRETKYCVPVGGSFQAGRLPLAAIIELTGERSNLPIAICEPVGKLQSLPLLHRHTYRYQLLGRMNLLLWHFGQSAALASKVPLYSMNRPDGDFTAHQMAEAIIETLAVGQP